MGHTTITNAGTTRVPPTLSTIPFFLRKKEKENRKKRRTTIVPKVGFLRERSMWLEETFRSFGRNAQMSEKTLYMQMTQMPEANGMGIRRQVGVNWRRIDFPCNRTSHCYRSPVFVIHFISYFFVLYHLRCEKSISHCSYLLTLYSPRLFKDK